MFENIGSGEATKEYKQGNVKVRRIRDCRAPLIYLAF